MRFPLLGLTRDLHPLDNAHAERTIAYTTLRDTGLCIFLSPTGSITAGSALILSKGLIPVFVIRKRHKIPPGGLYYQLLLSGKHSKDHDIVVFINEASQTNKHGCPII